MSRTGSCCGPRASVPSLGRGLPQPLAFLKAVFRQLGDGRKPCMFVLACGGTLLLQRPASSISSAPGAAAAAGAPP